MCMVRSGEGVEGDGEVTGGCWVFEVRCFQKFGLLREREKWILNRA